MFEMMFGLVFVLVIGVILVRLFQGVSQWNRNNHAPVLTVDATIVTKRTQVSHHQTGTAESGMHMHSATTYFATFQVESGDRIELQIPNSEFGMLVEGDRGRLTFQGTRYQGFQRRMKI